MKVKKPRPTSPSSLNKIFDFSLNIRPFGESFFFRRIPLISFCDEGFAFSKGMEV